MPQGAISVVGMAFVFADCFRVIPIYRNGAYNRLSIEAQRREIKHNESSFVVWSTA